MKVLKTDSDIGSIKIYNETMALYISNGIGDVPSKVVVCEDTTEEEQKLAWQALQPIEADRMVDTALFDVKAKAYLSDYDCEEHPIYEFKPGTYFVTLYENATFLISWAKNRHG